MEEDMEIDHEETVTIPEDCCLASSGSVSVDEGDVEEGIDEEVEENIDEKVDEEIQEEADEEIDEEVEEDPIPRNQREVQRRSFKRTFTDVKRNLLMARFQENPYPSEEDEEYLAMVTGLTKTKIRDWFSYKRCLQGKSNN
ncbi:hypothetical protein L3Y34_019445 [Caenorhabditis briggsae]|uniref:Homeobox domain-containing protein n=1 Tax=Caenorhabditis briggsae TaxID=6238 RepID=A0AAE9IWP6_CAEBR|nr:hypothetical protein L3Y34_019445 [Caenorhabditis briggsae]